MRSLAEPGLGGGVAGPLSIAAGVTFMAGEDDAGGVGGVAIGAADETAGASKVAVSAIG